MQEGEAAAASRKVKLLGFTASGSLLFDAFKWWVAAAAAVAVAGRAWQFGSVCVITRGSTGAHITSDAGWQPLVTPTGGQQSSTST